ncbi:MAG: toprim domain-containing protein, partial [Erysipelotrichaceae bacterium]|nr:toprim domain-containing protein [Erysipelotrichaceae bacterium]
MYPSSIQKLIESFRSLPGVGEKTAERYALSVSEMDPARVEQFAEALVGVKEKLRRCRICGNLSDQDECEICRNPDRSHKLIFVVQSPKDVIAMEKTGEFRGVYHVLNGV